MVVREAPGEAPEPLFTRADMLAIGQAVAASILRRTDAGRSADGERDFDAYSDTPTYISKSDFPAPRGGEPKGKTVFYPNGYRQYKADTLGSARPNLTKSGEMLRSFGVRNATASEVSIGVSDPMVGRALGNQATRPWMGFTESTMAELEAAVQEVIDRKDLLADTTPTTKVVP